MPRSALHRYRCPRGLATLMAWALFACGNPGESGKSNNNGGLGQRKTITGSIADQTGEQGTMENWRVALVDRDSAIARVATVDAAGFFTLSQVYTARPYTIAILSPASVLQGVLAIGDGASGEVRQYFTLTGTRLPHLIHRGKVAAFEELSGITLATGAATDSDKDGTPDGAATFGLTGVDTDGDGTPNAEDGDIDGDGRLNIFDPDDDGDEIIDPFDSDADGDGTDDINQKQGDSYFERGLEWIAVKLAVTPQGDGTVQRTLTLLARTQEDVASPTITIVGPGALLTDATAEFTDSSGNTSTDSWDGTLADDGSNSDSAAKDGLFGRKLILDAGRQPTERQVLSFQLGTTWKEEFLYTFPAVTLSTLTGSYDSSTRTFTLSGSPFGEVTDFLWTVTIIKVEGGAETNVYASSPQSGAEPTYVLPSHVLETGGTYKYQMSAYVTGGVAGHAAYQINTAPTDIPSL